jgi:hypothetical protein
MKWDTQADVMINNNNKQQEQELQQVHTFQAWSILKGTPNDLSSIT